DPGGGGGLRARGRPERDRERYGRNAMSREIEELLRDGLDRLTAGASAPADLVQRARQARRRHLAARGGLATGAAAAVAGTVALAVAVAGGGGGGLASTAGGPAQPANA